MFLAAVLASALVSPTPPVGRLAALVSAIGVQEQQAPAPQDQQTPPAAPSPAPPAAAPSKPCAETPKSSSSSTPNCTPTASQKKRRKKQNPTPAAGAPAEGPTKTVVRNGSTTDPTVELSPGLPSQQASQQIKATDQLLASTDANLKALSGRQLNAGQQDTVNQIKSFMEQSRTASRNGDVQRAYTLANKANMLSADLKTH